MISTLVVSTLLSLCAAHAQQTPPPPAGATPPPVGTPNKPPAMMPLPPAPTDTKITGNECTEEAKKAQCKSTTLSEETVKCMYAFKGQPTHKDFSVSPTCRMAIQKWYMANKHH